MSEQEPAFAEAGRRVDPETGAVTVSCKFHRARRRHSVALKKGPRPPPPKTVRRPAKIARLLAEAHQIQRDIDAGEIEDQARAAERLSVTRARVTQLMKLLSLAPDIQEQLLFMEAVDGLEPMTERRLRPVTAHASWAGQRGVWKGIRKGGVVRGGRGQ